jgi:hypothetical protein
MMKALCLFMLICIFFVPSKFKCNKTKQAIGGTLSQATADTDTGSTAAVSTYAYATQGLTSVAASTAHGEANDASSDATMVSVANAGNNKYVESKGDEESAANTQYTKTGDVNTKTTTEVTQGQLTTKTVNQKDQASYDRDTLGEVKTKTTSNDKLTTVVAKTFDSAEVNGSSKNGENAVDVDYDRQINISFDAGNDKIIVEKIMNQDGNILLVTAAKSLLTQLTEADKKYILQLYNGKCNCGKIKSFLYNLLSVGV